MLVCYGKAREKGSGQLGLRSAKIFFLYVANPFKVSVLSENHIFMETRNIERRQRLLREREAGSIPSGKRCWYQKAW